jgi:hypothetical protein
MLLSFLDPLLAVIALSTGHPPIVTIQQSRTDLLTDLVGGTAYRGSKQIPRAIGNTSGCGCQFAACSVSKAAPDKMTADRFS